MAELSRVSRVNPGVGAEGLTAPRLLGVHYEWQLGAVPFPRLRVRPAGGAEEFMPRMILSQGVGGLG